MPLVNERAPGCRGEREIIAMAFRDDGSAERIAISNLSFDACSFASAAIFTIGERVRLHIRGQGWIDAHVDEMTGGLYVVAFSTHCLV